MAKEIVKPATGKLGIMVVGLGAVSTTFMTGVMMIRKGLAKPVGSMTQYDKIRIGKGADKKYLHYNEIVSMPSLDDIEFAAWDVSPRTLMKAQSRLRYSRRRTSIPLRTSC